MKSIGGLLPPWSAGTGEGGGEGWRFLGQYTTNLPNLPPRASFRASTGHQRTHPARGAGKGKGWRSRDESLPLGRGSCDGATVCVGVQSVVFGGSRAETGASGWQNSAARRGRDTRPTGEGRDERPLGCQQCTGRKLMDNPAVENCDKCS